jgi:hypothetical protein
MVMVVMVVPFSVGHENHEITRKIFYLPRKHTVYTENLTAKPGHGFIQPAHRFAGCLPWVFFRAFGVCPWLTDSVRALSWFSWQKIWPLRPTLAAGYGFT